MENSSTSQISVQQPQVTHLSSTEDLLEELKGEFESRFSDVNDHKEIFSFIENNFHVDVSSLTPTITQLCPDERAAFRK